MYIYKMSNNNLFYIFINYNYRNCIRSSLNSPITVESCLNALFKAKWYRFFDFNDFNLHEYEKHRVSYNIICYSSDCSV